MYPSGTCLFDNINKLIWFSYEEACFIPNIWSSADLRNNYNEISSFCNTCLLPKMEKMILQLWVSKPMNSRPAGLNYTTCCKKAWRRKRPAKSALLLKQWRTCGSSEKNELPASNHKPGRTGFMLCGGLYGICFEKSPGCGFSILLKWKLDLWRRCHKGTRW